MTRYRVTCNDEDITYPIDAESEPTTCEFCGSENITVVSE